MTEVTRKVSDSTVETIHLVRPTYLNSAGRLFGGMLLQWIDETAGIVAKRHCRSNASQLEFQDLYQKQMKNDMNGKRQKNEKKFVVFREWIRTMPLTGKKMENVEATFSIFISRLVCESSCTRRGQLS